MAFLNLIRRIGARSKLESLSPDPFAGGAEVQQRDMGIFRPGQVFEGADDRFNCSFPLICFALVIFEWIFDFQVPYRLASVAAEIFLLNTTHVVLTFVLIANLPELKEWVNESTGGNAAKIWRPVVLSGSSVFLIALGAQILTGDFLKPAFSSLMGILAITVPLFHGCNQYKGISLAYNQKLRSFFELDEPGQRRAQLCELREKKAFVFYYCSVVGLATVFFFDFTSIHVTLSNNVLLALRWSAFLSSVVAAGFVVFNSLTFPYSRQSYKTLFLTRLWLYPLSGFSKMALLGAAATHGVEYFFVYRGMRDRSAVSATQRSRLNKQSLFYCGLVGILDLPVIFDAKGIGAVFCFSFVNAIIYAHYHMDRILFRMRNPMTRKIVGKLLIAQVPSTRKN